MLTRHTDQIITGNIKIHGNVFVANNTGVSIRHLSTTNNVFGVALDTLLDDCVQHVSKEPIHLAANKLVNQMYVGHLVVETDFWQTGQPNGPERSTAAIVALYKSLRDGITLDGESADLRNQFVIDQMDVTDTINGMPSATFGQEWLLTERDQVRASWCPNFLIRLHCFSSSGFRRFRWPKRSPVQTSKTTSFCLVTSTATVCPHFIMRRYGGIRCNASN